MAERDSYRGLRPGGVLHHASQQNPRQAAKKLLGHDAEAQGQFTPQLPSITSCIANEVKQ